jgi:hypothetical protein
MRDRAPEEPATASAPLGAKDQAGFSAAPLRWGRPPIDHSSDVVELVPPVRAQEVQTLQRLDRAQNSGHVKVGVENPDLRELGFFRETSEQCAPRVDELPKQIQ